MLHVLCPPEIPAIPSLLPTPTHPPTHPHPHTLRQVTHKHMTKILKYYRARFTNGEPCVDRDNDMRLLFNIVIQVNAPLFLKPWHE